MSSLQFPATESDITVDFLKSCCPLFRHVNAVKFDPAPKIGLMAQTRICHLTYEEGDREQTEPVTIVAKYCGVDHTRMLGTHAKGNFYKIEVGFYEYFSKQEVSLLELPEIYFASYDPETGKYIILMEFGIGTSECQNPMIPLSSDLCETVLKKLAPFHAEFWHTRAEASAGPNPLPNGWFVGSGDQYMHEHFPELDFLPRDFALHFHGHHAIQPQGHGQYENEQFWLPVVDEEDNLWAAFSEENFEAVLKKMEASWTALSAAVSAFTIPDTPPEDDPAMAFFHATVKKYQRVIQLPYLDVVRERFGDMFRTYDVTIRHGDFRKDNIVFNGDLDRLVVFDWQTVGLGNPLLDVSSIIHNMAGPDIVANEQKFLQLYLDSMKAYWDSKGDASRAEVTGNVTLEKVKEMYRTGFLYTFAISSALIQLCFMFAPIPKAARPPLFFGLAAIGSVAADSLMRLYPEHFE